MVINEVLGIPMLKSNVNDFCNECPTGKQTKASHPSLGKCTTSKVLQLLHLDLMGPIDHDREFENSAFKDFYEFGGIFHEFLAPLMPQ
ncbi:gag-pol polyprotein [Cucumis melo var. makuwa]|uniref:Gag-pol polyprotein n=1 Tax=Cucumis melo var. makuwa TaxID=1194695 RepID=A0A5D3CXW8_CUCMM|nr:gag-pol polyprotein [Cucumis melo var. makuwa]